MSRRTRTMTFMISIAVLLALAYGISSKVNRSEEATTAAESEEGSRLLEISGKDITKISFSNEKSSGDTPQAVLTKKDSQWLYAEDEEYPVDETKIEAMTDALANLTYSGQIDSESVELKDYGVDVEGSPDDIVLTVSFDAGGNSYTYYFGDYNAITAGYYMVTDTMDEIYMIESSIITTFDYDICGLLVLEEMPEIESDYLTGIAVVTPEKSYVFDYEITTEESTEEEGEDTSYITWYRKVTDIATGEAGDRATVDSTVFSQAVSDILGITPDKAAAYKPSEAMLSEYGLTIPEYTVVLTYLDSEDTGTEKTLTLYMGSSGEDGTYMRIEGSEMVLIVDDLDLSGILE